MQTNIQSLHFKANEQLTEFVNHKMQKLAHLNDRIISSDVCLKLDKADDRENKVCEIRILIPGHNLFAKRQCQTFEEATNEAIHAIQEQLLKKKEEHAKW
jgi:putative sigma-54 modulation protein